MNKNLAKVVYNLRKVRAVFLDRDGTINAEVNYLSRVEDWQLLPQADTAIRLLNEQGWRVAVITNQAGVGRGYYPAEAVAALHAHLRAELARVGARVDGIYVCPHHPDDNCECRKPKTRLFEQAAREFDIDLSASYAVGDKLSDLIPGRALGCRAILVLTGHGQTHRAMAEQQGFQPDHIADDLYQAVQWILQHEASIRL